MSEKYYIGVDIGGTKISSALVTDFGQISFQNKVAVPKVDSNEAFIDAITPLLEETISQAKSFDQILGFGFGVPGLVDHTGTILNMPNLGLTNLALKKEVESRWNTPCAVGNDVNLGLLGEFWLGCAQKKDSIIGIFPGTGIGGAIILNGKIVLGTNGAAAELGHTIIDPDGPICSCGNKGCLEAFAGRWAIERDIKAFIENGESSIVTELTNNFAKPIKSKIIKKSLEKNDAVVTKVMESVATHLGLACINFRHTFDPQAFVFGGGVIEACEDFLIPRIQKIVDDDPFFKSFGNCPIKAAKLGDNAVLLGAVALISNIDQQWSLEKKTCYPCIQQTEDNLLIDNKKIKESFTIKANASLSERKKHDPTNLYLIEINEVKNLIKCLTRLIIITGEDYTKLSLSDEAKEFLKEKNIVWGILNLPKAIELYNTTEKHKAFIYAQE